ncbi:MAG TPA: DinB family protein [Fimbriimonas sp.]|nr:DinB family protein [Fimbriimonas sp.]
MGNVYLVPALRAAPSIVRKLVKTAGPEVFDWKTDPERFSFREAIAHLADWEPIMLERLRQAKERPGSTLTAYNETQRAREQNYGASNPLQKVEEWAQLREQTVKWIETEAEGSWDSKVVHPERGDLTLYDLANILACHDTYHVDHLMSFLPG